VVLKTPGSIPSVFTVPEVRKGAKICENSRIRAGILSRYVRDVSGAHYRCENQVIQVVNEADQMPYMM
jgi:hypothetical protein